MLKVTEVHGFTIFYDGGRRKFIIVGGDGTEEGFGENQDEAEAKAKLLSKREFKRIKILQVQDRGRVTGGELTSFNHDDYSAWVSLEKSTTSSSGRQKINLKYEHDYFEATEANLKVAETIKTKRLAAEQLSKNILELRSTLEKPINLKYFGIGS